MTVIAIAGIPRAGKTTLAEELVRGGQGVVLSTDAVAGLGWSEASAEVATWFDLFEGAPAPVVIEGVAVPRALRKWLAQHPDGKPCDTVYWLGTARVTLTSGQGRMAKGCWTVFEPVRLELLDRGVALVHDARDGISYREEA